MTQCNLCDGNKENCDCTVLPFKKGDVVQLCTGIKSTDFTNTNILENKNYVIKDIERGVKIIFLPKSNLYFLFFENCECLKIFDKCMGHLYNPTFLPNQYKKVVEPQ